MDKDEVKQYIECDCGDFDHIFRITYWKDDPDFIYLSVHLRQQTFLRRLWHAIKYVFGYRSKYGDFDEFLLNPKDAEKFKEVLGIFLEAHNSGDKRV